MLVVEDRNRAAVVAEDVDDLREEFGSRVELLALGIGRVLAVFGDHHHAVDGQSLATAAEGVGNGLVESETELAGTFGRQVTLGKTEFLFADLLVRGGRLLSDKGRDDFDPGFVPVTLVGIPDKESVTDVLAMTEVSPQRGDDCDPFFGTSFLRGRFLFVAATGAHQ